MRTLPHISTHPKAVLKTDGSIKRLQNRRSQLVTVKALRYLSILLLRSLVLGSVSTGNHITC